MIDNEELARRSILGFGEMIATLGRGVDGTGAEVRWPNALGARIDAVSDNPWFNAVVVPPGEQPPFEDPCLPKYVWTLANAVPGRVEDPAIALPCMGIALDNPTLQLDGAAEHVDAVPFEVLGDMNERAYGDFGWFSPLVQKLRDDRIRTHGLRDESGRFVCVALTLAVGDDLAIFFVATEESHRRRGLASSLLRAVMGAARKNGMLSATLQASSDGLPVWERLGFRVVTVLRGYARLQDGG